MITKVYIKLHENRWKVYTERHIPPLTYLNIPDRETIRLFSIHGTPEGARAVGRAAARLHQAKLIDTSQTVTN